MPISDGAQQGNYYYAPYSHDGEWETKLGNWFGDAGQAIASAVLSGIFKEDPALEPALGISTVASAIAEQAGQNIGFFIDNVSNIEQNGETFLKELSDINIWITQGPDSDGPFTGGGDGEDGGDGGDGGE